MAHEDCNAHGVRIRYRNECTTMACSLEKLYPVASRLVSCKSSCFRYASVLIFFFADSIVA